MALIWFAAGYVCGLASLFAAVKFLRVMDDAEHGEKVERNRRTHF